MCKVTLLWEKMEWGQGARNMEWEMINFHF
jgi:hypothetical protein